MAGAKIFFYCCIIFCVGVSFASLLEISGFLIIGAIIFAVFLFLAGLAAKKKKVAVAGIFGIFQV